MARFDFSGFAPSEPEADAGATPAPAFDLIDATHVNGALNDFLAAKQDALFHAPDAFYRTMGRDALQAAPAADDRLEQLRADALAGVANDNQRRHLGDMLDAQMHLARADMARHVATQTEAWQRQTAQDRIEALTKEAALHHSDPGLIDSLASAAEDAARAHATPDEADAAAAQSRSGVLSSAIQAHLRRGNTSDAAAQLDRLKDQLSAEHAEPLQAQLDTAQRFDAARAYADGVVPATRAATADEIEAQRAAVTQQAAADHPDDEMQRALAQHFIDVGFDGHRTQLDRATAERDQAVQHWLTTPDADGEPQTSPPPPVLWNKLDPEEQAKLLAQLRLNGRPAESEEDAQPPRPSQASSMVLPALGGAPELGEAIARAAPYAGRAAGIAGALLIPGNTPTTTTEVGDGLRIRSAPGQRTVTIERRVDDGLLGTGVGARWEELPVQAEHATAPDGRSIIAIDPQQLEKAIGPEAANRIREQAGIAMARPPRDGNDEEQPRRNGDNSNRFPDPDDEQQTPPPPVDREAAARARKAADDAVKAGILGKQLDSVQERRETRQAAGDIAAHAYENHRHEFPEVQSPSEFARHVENAMNNATDSHSDGNGRTIYWHASSGTFVARNRDDPEAGTAMKPPDGKNYYDIARRRMIENQQNELRRR